jgi:signal transduction histidine kinase
VLAVVEPLARQKQLPLHHELPPEPVRITSDIDKVRQILVNLAGNAIKFTDEGSVRLSVCRDGADVRFTVRDTGIGVSKADLELLFHPFAQLDTSLTRRHGGTGLGLYISRRLAELLGGHIAVESEVGKGSAFTLVLPVETEN